MSIIFDYNRLSKTIINFDPILIDYNPLFYQNNRLFCKIIDYNTNYTSIIIDYNRLAVPLMSQKEMKMLKLSNSDCKQEN